MVTICGPGEDDNGRDAAADSGRGATICGSGSDLLRPMHILG